MATTKIEKSLSGSSPQLGKPYCKLFNYGEYQVKAASQVPNPDCYNTADSKNAQTTSTVFRIRKYFLGSGS
jgi:hypothetical protein